MEAERPKHRVPPLKRYIQRRLGDGFDASVMLDDSQRQFNRALYILYRNHINRGPDRKYRIDRKQLDRTSKYMNLGNVRALVNQVHGELLSTIFCVEGNPGSFVWYTFQDEVIVEISYYASLKLRFLPLDAMAVDLWRLCAVEVFWDELSRKRFTGFSERGPAAEHRDEDRQPREDSRIINRMLCDSIRPFFTRPQRHPESINDFMAVVEYHMDGFFENVRSRLYHLHGKRQKYARTVLEFSPLAVTRRLARLWIFGAFHREEVARKLLDSSKFWRLANGLREDDNSLDGAMLTLSTMEFY
ncbi:hypothetical protein M426DRAFT_16691 [Hypoxylon sp. CI-4A]|nr:hypothetical protein M426DRAFT_16691 [Hypoxylon sp. CI-4A]